MVSVDNVQILSSYDLATKPDQIGPISCDTVFMSSSGRPRKTHLILFYNQTALLFLEEMIQEMGILLIKRGPKY